MCVCSTECGQGKTWDKLRVVMFVQTAESEAYYMLFRNVLYLVNHGWPI